MSGGGGKRPDPTPTRGPSLDDYQTKIIQRQGLIDWTAVMRSRPRDGICGLQQNCDVAREKLQSDLRLPVH